MTRSAATDGSPSDHKSNTTTTTHHNNNMATASTSSSSSSSPSGSMSGRYKQPATNGGCGGHHAHKHQNGKMDDSFTSLIKAPAASKPLGVRLLEAGSFMPRSAASKRSLCKWAVLALTYVAYTAFHMGRRPMSIVKNVLHPSECDGNHTDGHLLLAGGSSSLELDDSAASTPSAWNISEPCGWAPFDDNLTATSLLGLVDTAFLSAYAVFMFVSGFVAERVNLRYFVSLGCALSGVFLIVTGLAQHFQIHSLAFFVGVQIASGVAQTSGWPVVVTCVGNWFDKSERSFIYGIWNSHTNLGNVLGAVIAGLFVQPDWGMSFIVPGAIMIGVALVLLLFLVPEPRDVGLAPTTSDQGQYQYHQDTFGSTASASIIVNGASGGDQLAAQASGQTSIASSVVVGELENQLGSTVSVHSTSPATTPLPPELVASYQHQNSLPTHQRLQGSVSSGTSSTDSGEAVGFLKALLIPGVVEYSLCLFFSKLVIYTFVFWLPKYIAHSMSSDSQDSAYLSVWFDLGGMLGAAIAGILSNKFDFNGLICMVTLMLAMPAMFAFEKVGSTSVLNNILLQSLVGGLVNGPYCLITTSVSADLGERIKDKHATATVAAIIDGMGSLGAVVGPLVAGFIANSDDWSDLFTVLIISNALAAVCLIRIVLAELKYIFGDHQDHPSLDT